MKYGASVSTSYRALRPVLDVVDGQFHLRLLVEVGLLEEGNATEEDGVTGSLWTEQLSINSSNDRHCSNLLL